MIIRTEGNLFDCGADALVNPVNTQGVMGAGLAREFKTRYPSMFKAYATRCTQGDLRYGVVHVWLNEAGRPRYILNVPTKEDWRNRSSLNGIRLSLAALARTVAELQIHSVAVPALGCGRGGADWGQVRPLIVNAFEAVPDEVMVFLFEPR